MKAKFKINDNNIKGNFRINNPVSIITRAEFDSVVGALNDDIDLINNDIDLINGALFNYGDIVTHNVSEFATAQQGAKANSALQPNDNISLLTNDAEFVKLSDLNGFATKTWVNEQNYLSEINSNDVINALNYTPYNATNPNGYQANVIETVKVNNTALNIVNKTVNITVPTNAGDINAVPTSRKINGKSLTGDINIDFSDVGALSEKTTIEELATKEQFSAINSGITDKDVDKIQTALQPNDNISLLTNNAHYISGINSSDVVGALGFTPVNPSNLANVATSGDYDDLSDKPMPNPAFATSTSTASTVEKVVSIPSITQLNVGQIIIVQPSETSTVANSTIKLNDFPAYSMRYNNASITTSTDSIVWSSVFVSAFIFDGTYWQFLCHGLDSNTTYSLNYSMDAGTYTVGAGSYAVTRYCLMLQKADMTWEKPTDPTAKYTTATTKTVNNHGFRLGQIKYYSSTSNFANGAKIATNTVYDKSASVDLRYSTNCGNAPAWTAGDYIYLVGNIGADGLFYLDSTTWWSNTLPNTNDGKVYIRLGIFLTDAKISLLSKHPIFYNDGTSIKEYIVASCVDESWLDNYIQTKYGLTPVS